MDLTDTITTEQSQMCKDPLHDHTNIEEKIFQLMHARKIFTQQYLSAREEFSRLLSQQSELIPDDHNKSGTKDEGVSEKIKITSKDNIRKLSATIKLILETDPLILNSTKNFKTPDDYLFQHSINVCYVGTMVLRSFNTLFSNNINRMLNQRFYGEFNSNQENSESFLYYQKEAIDTISMGYLIHDIGKLMLPNTLLNKRIDLTAQEFEEIKRHSFDYGMQLLIRNDVRNIYVENIVQYHHAPIYSDEKKSYPNNKTPNEIPPYVKICKLADIYSAMTSKRAYGEAINPVRAVNTIFRNYSGKDPMLQFILYSFMRELGIYPVGSIFKLKNGQLAYVINSSGPEVIIFNDITSLDKKVDMPDRVLNLSREVYKSVNLSIDSSQLPKTPNEMFEKVPNYLKEFHKLLEEE